MRLTRVFITIAAAGALLAPATAQAAYPGANGKLVFFQDDVGSDEPVGLAVSDANGGNQTFTPLGGVACDFGSAGACPTDPVWSPDGRRIAFGLGDTVATIRPDGTDLRKLPLTGVSQVGSPTWSPDGNRIAFDAVQGGRLNVFIAGANGSALVRRTGAGAAQPAWSVRGEIVFTRARNLYVVGAESGSARRLTGRGGRAGSWSPDGTAVAFLRRVRGGRLVLFRTSRNGGSLKRLTSGSAADPAWTPDGRWVLFDRFDGFNSVIYRTGARGQRGGLLTSGIEGRRNAVFGVDEQPVP